MSKDNTIQYLRECGWSDKEIEDVLEIDMIYVDLNE